MISLRSSPPSFSLCCATPFATLPSRHGCFLKLSHPFHPPSISMALSEPLAPPPQLSFDLPSYLQSKTHAIVAALDLAIPLRQPASIYESMRYSIFADSRRVCSLLCISSCELVGGSEELAMPTACALEMVHTASLIHDDLPCMDDDELRRGKLANHKVFGEDLAILAGDALYSLGVEHVARSSRGASGDSILRVIAELGKAVGSDGMVSGQYLELASEGNENLSLQDLQNIHLRKTAVLAECSMVCGAVLGGAEEEQIENLRLYGRTLGLLYEVVEDILDAQQIQKTSENSSKATYTQLLGFDKCKDFARELQHRAKEYLQIFDSQKAVPLLCFVDDLAERI